MSKKNDEKATSKILKKYGYLNDKKSKVVAKVSWNDGTPKINIRSCFMKDGELFLGKGVTLDRDEAIQLQTTLKKALADTENDEESEDKASHKPKPVDFNDIFSQASSIVEKRDAGFTTEDGFIKMKFKPGVKRPW